MVLGTVTSGKMILEILMIDAYLRRMKVPKMEDIRMKSTKMRDTKISPVKMLSERTSIEMTSRGMNDLLEFNLIVGLMISIHGMKKIQ